MTDRCHLYLPLVDSSGVLYPYAQVTLLDPSTNEAIVSPVYAEPVGGVPITFPAFFDPAVVDLWVDAPMRVTVLAVMAHDITVTLVGIDLSPSPPNSIRTETPVRFAAPVNIDSTAVLVTGLDGNVSWQVPDVFSHHSHRGDAPDSVVVGTLDPANWASRQVWIGTGVGSPTDQAANEIGIGTNTAPHGADAVAIGISAAAYQQAVSVGAAAQAALGSVAIGSAAASTGQRQAIIGRSVTSAATEAVAVGSGLTAASLALGSNVRTTALGDLLVGSGAVPNTTGWVGPFVHLLGNTVAPWYLSAPGDAMLCGGGSPLAAYGTSGGYKTLIDGTGTTGAVASFLSALNALGLIYLVDGSTFSDTMANFSKMSAHAAELVVDTLNPANFDGRTSRLKRNDPTGDVPRTFTYTQPSPVTDFAMAVYAKNTSPGSSVAVTASDGVGAAVPVPVGTTPSVATAGGWYRSWFYPVRQLPPGMKVLNLTLQNDAVVYSPQVGQIWLR